MKQDNSDSSPVASKVDVYDIITDRICAALESGVIPWHKPWKNTGNGMELPRNFITKRPYSGINPFILLCSGYDCPFWLSFKQAKEAGGMVRKGEKGFPVVFWKRLPKHDKDGKPVLNANGKPEMVFFLRYYTVFNVEQCDGLKWEKPAPVAKPEDWNPIAEAVAIADGMPNRPEIQHKGNRACYSPALDLVRMPEKESFPVPAEYYSTLFHELAHSTGHKSRLNRKGIADDEGKVAAFGSETYAREELVAEMSAAFLCGHAGIIQTTIDNSAAYVAGWLKALKNDKKLVVIAAAQAQKAADYIRGVKREETSEE